MREWLSPRFYETIPLGRLFLDLKDKTLLQEKLSGNFEIEIPDDISKMDKSKFDELFNFPENINQCRERSLKVI